MLVSIVFLVGTILGMNDASSLSNPRQTQVVIEAGDTLWDIASAYGPQGQDRRIVVRTICQLNGVSPETIRPGQTILVPAAL